MKTYKALIGEALINIGIGGIGFSLLAGFIQEKSYYLAAAILVAGSTLIHVGATLAKTAKPPRCDK